MQQHNGIHASAALGTTMPPLRVVVCVKAVPRSEEVRMNEATRTLDRSSARTELNPADLYALELALALRDRNGGQVSLLSMGPPLFVPYLRVGLAMGADAAYLLSDRAFGGADTLATSYTLAKGIERIARETGHVDLVVCGEESSDGATAQVPPGIAEWLKLPQATYVTAASLEEGSSFGFRASSDGGTLLAARNVERGTSYLHVQREIKGGHEVLRVPLPAVLSVASSSDPPRFFDPARRAWAAAAEITIWDAAAVDADPQFIGAAGSATEVAGLARAGRPERRREQVRGTPEDEARALAGAIRAALGA